MINKGLLLLLLLVIATVAGSYLVQSQLAEGFNLAMEVITPRVPLVLPPEDLPLAKLDRTFENNCSSDLECPYPLKCCNGKCRIPLMTDQIRGDNLYAPQRMKICPPEKFNKPCKENAMCNSNHLECVADPVLGNVCKGVPVMFDGPFCPN